MTVFPSKNSLYMERWLSYFSEIVVCLPCLSVASLTSLHPLLIQHSWSSVNHSLPTMGRVETTQHHAVWPKVPPKFPLSTAAVFQGPIRGLDSILLLEKLRCLSAKSPVFPTQVWMSPVAQLMLRQRISTAWASRNLLSPSSRTRAEKAERKIFCHRVLEKCKQSYLGMGSHPFSFSFLPAT